MTLVVMVVAAATNAAVDTVVEVDIVLAASIMSRCMLVVAVAGVYAVNRGCCVATFVYFLLFTSAITATATLQQRNSNNNSNSIGTNSSISFGRRFCSSDRSRCDLRDLLLLLLLLLQFYQQCDCCCYYCCCSCS